MITWRKVDDDRIRSDDATYWVTRAPIRGRMVYTAAWRPQDVKQMGAHLGCYDDGAAAKRACQDHAQQRAAA